MIINITKNRWLFENGQINSDCESCLTYSKINLVMLYRNRKTMDIFQIFRLSFLICFMRIVNSVINNKIHSKIMENRFVLILSDESILS